jgi:hypothetical protein
VIVSDVNEVDSRLSEQARCDRRATKYVGFGSGFSGGRSAQWTFQVRNAQVGLTKQRLDIHKEIVATRET